MANLLTDGGEVVVLLLLLLALPVLGAHPDGPLLLLALDHLGLNMDGLLGASHLVAVLDPAIQDELKSLLEKTVLVPAVVDLGQLSVGDELDLVDGLLGSHDLDVGDEFHLVGDLVLLHADGGADEEVLLGVAALHASNDLHGGDLAGVAHLGESLVGHPDVHNPVDAPLLVLGTSIGSETRVRLANLAGLVTDVDEVLALGEVVDLADGLGDIGDGLKGGQLDHTPLELERLVLVVVLADLLDQVHVADGLGLDGLELATGKADRNFGILLVLLGGNCNMRRNLS